MSEPRLESAIPVLPVHDVPKAVAFYRERLGFAPRFEYGPYAGIARGPIEIHLDGSAPPAGPVSARFAVTGIEGLYAELQKQGVIDPAEPLETKPWGLRQFSAFDSDGNRLTFAEPAQPAAAAEPPKRRFAILFTHVEGEAQKVGEEDVPRLMERHRLWQTETDAQERSSLIYFAPASEARTVRLHADGRLEVQAGGFAGGKEAVGGFTIVEAESLEAAVEIAKRHRWMVGSNEVREIQVPPGAKSWIRTR
jgi:uncharacterized glyoxalase superfamily protein PhnB